MNKKDQIKEYLKGLNDSELLSIYNEFATETYDNDIYTMDEFDEICEGMTATDIARRIYNGDFRPNDEYFTFNGYDNLISTDFLEDFIDFDDLADYIVRSEEDFGDNDIREILDENED